MWSHLISYHCFAYGGIFHIIVSHTLVLFEKVETKRKAVFRSVCAFETLTVTWLGWPESHLNSIKEPILATRCFQTPLVRRKWKGVSGGRADRQKDGRTDPLIKVPSSTYKRRMTPEMFQWLEKKLEIEWLKRLFRDDECWGIQKRDWNCRKKANVNDIQIAKGIPKAGAKDYINTIKI